MRSKHPDHIERTTLLDRAYRTLVRQGMRDFKTDLARDASEDEIMAEAVRLTRRA